MSQASASVTRIVVIVGEGGAIYLGCELMPIFRSCISSYPRPFWGWSCLLTPLRGASLPLAPVCAYRRTKTRVARPNTQLDGFDRRRGFSRCSFGLWNLRWGFYRGDLEQQILTRHHSATATSGRPGGLRFCTPGFFDADPPSSRLEKSLRTQYIVTN